MQKIYPDKVLKKLSNLQFAINLLFVIGIVIACGTIIEQDQDISFYQTNYPQERPIFGFIDWKFLLFFNLDHVYTSYWFIALLILFGTSLLSCTLTVQFPVLRRLRRWQFFSKIQYKTGIEKSIPPSRMNFLHYNLHSSDYVIFRQGRKNYAYSGLLGRFGPIVVHASIILLLTGAIIGNFGGYIAQEFVPRGEVFHSQNFVKIGNYSFLPQNFSWRVNDFWIKYNETLTTNQFYSDLSILDNKGNEIKRKTVFVNEPFIFNGVTAYQTDWDILGLKYKLNDGNLKQLSFKKIKKFDQKFWFGSIVLDGVGSSTNTFSILCKDLTGNLYLYNSSGELVKEFQVGDLVNLNPDIYIEVQEMLSSTGLQIKTDPGIGIIYLSFFLLMVSTYTSFISYSQIWGLEKNNLVEIAGTSNRAVLFFQSYLKKLLAKVPPES